MCAATTMMLVILGPVLLGHITYVTADGSLHEAAAVGNLEKLKELVAGIPSGDVAAALTDCYKTPDKSVCIDASGSALSAACSFVNQNKQDCISVLQAAALGRQAAVVDYLVNELKAEVDWKNKAQKTALHYAFDSFTVYTRPCSEDFRNTVLALLKAGADPMIPLTYSGVKGYTVLHMEAYDGNRHGLLPALIAAGADVNAADDRGMTPLHQAAKCDFRLSCDDCGCAKNFCSSRTPVPCPSSVDGFTDDIQFFGAAPTLKYLVAKGGDPKAVAKDGTSVIDRLPIPSNPSDTSDGNWVSGTCKETYLFLKGLGAKRAGSA